MKASRAQRRALIFICNTGGWISEDPFVIDQRTLRVLGARGWARLTYSSDELYTVIGAEPTKLGLAAIRWRGHARLFAAAA